MKRFKVVTTVPVGEAEKVRVAIGKAGGGKQGNYSFCSFSTRGVGRFKPAKGARPSVGKIGKIEKVEEERIEVLCDHIVCKKVIKAIKKAHPYEEPVIDVYELREI